MGRGGYRRGRYQGRRYPRPPPETEYEETDDNGQGFDDSYGAPFGSKYAGFNPKYHPNTRKPHPFQKQPPQTNPFQQPFTHTHNNKHQNEQQKSGQQPQEEGVHHYHHHNHYYHHPDGVSPLPTQTATGTNNDIMMTDFSAIQVLEGRLSSLGSEVINFLHVMASQNDQTKQFVDSFVDYMKQSSPDSELGKVLIGNSPQQNGPQAAIVPPAAPSNTTTVAPSVASSVTPSTTLSVTPSTTLASSKTGSDTSTAGQQTFGKKRTSRSSVDSNDGRNMTPIVKKATRFLDPGQ
ncbi:hypothetical protein F5Y00DRAFT_262390 [Daldinia vernicosa]|uniref:uncharacterized protein n=1 Tax=Daldinia vernicosa TaxID=114800 RepID=UPI002007CAFD|nr:uncharacterized protein F5Y00DRAFT_262390 [Daldinia vernicosa]KAI0848603.1 hypothetical protein F5Y00DRAFT_262390 [Daldinia vernicosa]